MEPIKNSIKTRGDHFRFGSVFIKKVTKPKNFFLKKKQNRTETGSNRPVSVRFGSDFLGQKPVQTGLARFFRFWLGFFRFWLGFFGLARFFRFGSISARFGSVFFRFRFGSVFSVFWL